MLAVVRTCAVKGVSKTGKTDNKRITSLFALYFSGLEIACKSAPRLDLYPAGLEPASL
jgi:hypothetical protein